jgi:hypothetical protein
MLLDRRRLLAAAGAAPSCKPIARYGMRMTVRIWNVEMFTRT